MRKIASKMADADHLDECKLVLCKRCNEQFPAVGFDVHDAFCRKFLRIVSQGDASPEVIQEMLESGTIPHDLQADYTDSEDEESYEDTLCNICYNYFPKVYLKKHQKSCLLEQTADFHAFDAAKDKASQKATPLNEQKQPAASKRFTVPPRKQKPRDTEEDQKIKRETDASSKFQANEGTNATKTEAKAPKTDNKKVPNQKQDSRKAIPTATKMQRDDIFDEPTWHEPQPSDIPYDDDKGKTNPLFDESRTFKIPYNPLLNHVDLTENEELDNILDDKDSETLEDFWKRAQEAMRQKSFHL